MRLLHDGTITAMTFDEINQYLVTGSRDGDCNLNISLISSKNLEPKESYICSEWSLSGNYRVNS